MNVGLHQSTGYAHSQRRTLPETEAPSRSSPFQIIERISSSTPWFYDILESDRGLKWSWASMYDIIGIYLTFRDEKMHGTWGTTGATRNRPQCRTGPRRRSLEMDISYLNTTWLYIWHCWLVDMEDKRIVNVAYVFKFLFSCCIKADWSSILISRNKWWCQMWIAQTVPKDNHPLSSTNGFVHYIGNFFNLLW